MREAKFVKSLTVALSVDVYQKIEQITDDEKISMAQWARRAICEPRKATLSRRNKKWATVQSVKTKRNLKPPLKPSSIKSLLLC